MYGYHQEQHLGWKRTHQSVATNFLMVLENHLVVLRPMQIDTIGFNWLTPKKKHRHWQEDLWLYCNKLAIRHKIIDLNEMVS